ncbi:paired amphipathic helix protein Sin3-like 4 [Vicia villosa]|uniref:paired amphipathic helix protein Sin3-like 4 n=1 Tax=Vicia villosa TaxID=3911 RepID=UPI00273BAF37|nr:paired amphipathic helix protein Sin3-like 4 [Vicia villosa]
MPSQYVIKLPLDHDDKQQQYCRLEKEDPLGFLTEVGDMFQGKNKGKYDEFLGIMKDFKANRIDTSVVMERVKELFKGHITLILGFYEFLPEEYHRLEEEHALAFVKKVGDVFQGENREKYDEFLEIFKDFKARRIYKIRKQVYLVKTHLPFA